MNDVAKIILEFMELNEAKLTDRPVLHGVGWPGDVKRIALNIEKLKTLGWRPARRSKEALAEAAHPILNELNRCKTPNSRE